MRKILYTTLCFLGCFAYGMASDVTTYHNDNKRTAVNSQETTLTPANVTATKFGKVGFWPTDGLIVAMPLFVSGLSIGGGTHDVVYVVTEHDSIYAFDGASGQVLWRTSAIPPGEHVSSYLNCGSISPEIGITGTPVIDRANNAIYFVAATQDASNAYHQRLYALSLTAGVSLLPPREIRGTFRGSQGQSAVFNPGRHLQRPALLELNGYIYIGFGSHCDGRPYFGWLMEYQAATLQQTSLLNFAPNGNLPGGGQAALWMGGAGPAADSQGFIYVETANGAFDTELNSRGFPTLGDFGNSAVKIKPGVGSPMSIVDYFAMTNDLWEDVQDLDLGSGGPVVVDTFGAMPLVIVTGKDQNIYVLNRNDMGKWNPIKNYIYQELDGVVNFGMFSAPAFFNNTMYFGPEYGLVTAFPVGRGYLATAPSSQSTHRFPLRGSSVTISANGTSNGVVWAPECINCEDTGLVRSNAMLHAFESSEDTVPGLSSEVLHAFDASDLSREIYNTTQSGNRDLIGDGNKFITPLVANGRVYLGMTNGVVVFGLLSSGEAK
ncbi:MAG: pyrrolo-quinoline quinone [Candidatus Korobacteraceae bacterium]